MRCALILVLFGLVMNPVMAQEPIVRVTVTPETISVGEPVRLQVTVLVPTWFPRPPEFPSFELANAIVRLPPNSSRPTSERIGRDTWSGIVRNYQVFPLISATYRLNDLSMAVTYADPVTRQPITVDVPVPDIEIRAQVPSGAEALEPYIAGSSLTLTRDIDGDMESLQAGDALVLRYTAELDGMPAIFLPPMIGQIDNPGVSVYANEPVIEDDGLARRTEKITLVFENGGDFAVPEVSLHWWNTGTSSIDVATVPALLVAVAGPELTTVEEESPTAGWPMITLSIAVLLLSVLAVSRWIPASYRSYTAYKEKQRLTERYAFRQLRKMLCSGNARVAYHALLRWLDRLEPGLDARQFAVRYGDVEFQAQIEHLSRTLFLTLDKSVNFRKLDMGLVSARQNHLHACEKNNHFALPLMNP